MRHTGIGFDDNIFQPEAYSSFSPPRHHDTHYLAPVPHQQQKEKPSRTFPLILAVQNCYQSASPYTGRRCFGVEKRPFLAYFCVVHPAGWLAGCDIYRCKPTAQVYACFSREIPNKRSGGSFLHTRMCCIVCWTVKKEYTRDTRFPVCHRCSRNFGCVCVCMYVLCYSLQQRYVCQRKTKPWTASGTLSSAIVDIVP